MSTAWTTAEPPVITCQKQWEQTRLVLHASRIKLHALRLNFIHYDKTTTMKQFSKNEEIKAFIIIAIEICSSKLISNKRKTLGRSKRNS